jgi:Ca2+-binding EF-hand superfamily protein
MQGAFESIDLDLDGSVSAQEVKRVVGGKGLYVSEKEAELLIRKFDSDNDGKIRFAEVSLSFLN